MSLTPVTVHGMYVRQDDSTPATGTVTFTLNQAIKNSDDDVVIVPYDTVCTLSGGSFSIVLPALDDVGTTPAGVTYTVTERVEGSHRVFQLALSRLSTDADMALVSPGTDTDVNFVILASDVDVDSTGMNFISTSNVQSALGELDAAVEARYFIIPYGTGWPSARPDVPAVHWVGPVDPDVLAIDGDLWTNTS